MPKSNSKEKGSKKGLGKAPGRPRMSKRAEATLQRKEVTLTVEQFDSLQLLSHQLNRARDKEAEDTEPITTSALVRSAVEIMLSVRDKLHGNTERELLASLKAALGC